MADRRQPFIAFATGQTGVGKTYRTIQEMEEYVRKGGKVLIFDVNKEADYKRFPSLDFDIEAGEADKKMDTKRRDLMKVQGIIAFSRQSKPEIRRVTPLCKSGKEMTLDQKARAAFLLLEYFRNGWLVLEDLNNYLIGARSKDFISNLTTNRHRKQDIMIHLQSLRALDTRMWQNTTYIRFHKEVNNVDKIEENIPNYELVKIAQLIVNRQFLIGNIRFFVFVNVRENWIFGCSKESFITACQEFLSLRPKEFQPLLNAVDTNGRKKYATRLDAINAWIEARMYYFKDNSTPKKK